MIHGVGTVHPLISNFEAPKLILWRPIQSFLKIFALTWQFYNTELFFIV